MKEGGGSPNGAAVESGREKTTKKKKKRNHHPEGEEKNPPSEIYRWAGGKSFCCVFSQRINMQNRAVLLFSFLWKKKKVISEMGEQPLLIRNVARGPGRAGARTQRPPPRAAWVHDRGEPAPAPSRPEDPSRSLEKVGRPSPLRLPSSLLCVMGSGSPPSRLERKFAGCVWGLSGRAGRLRRGGRGRSSYRSGGCAGMWRGESRGGRRLLSLLLHLPQPPPGEARGGRPPRAGRAGAPRPRAGRASGGARGLDEVCAGRAWSWGEGSGDSWWRRRPPRPRRRRTKGGCAPAGPKGSRGGPRGRRPRPLVPVGAASSPAGRLGPGAPALRPTLPSRPPARGGVGRAGRRAPPAPGRGVSGKWRLGASPHTQSPFFSWEGTGWGRASQIRTLSFLLEQRSFTLKMR